MRRSRIVLMAVALATALHVGPTARSVEALFDDGVLHEVRLFLHSWELQELLDNIHENTFYPADLEWGDVVVPNVGVRSRGHASRNRRKPGFTVQIDRYTPGQRLFGLREIVLDNLWQDAGMIRQSMALTLFEAMGLPAPRQSFARLSINGVDGGVYGIVESVEDTSFVARHFGDASGYLFEYRRQFDYTGTYLGDDLEPYKVMYEARSRKSESDEVLWGPLRDLWREVNEPVDLAWRARVGAHLDLEQFVTTVAVDTFTAEQDGIVGSHGMNNFYLYRDAGTLQHRVIVWDRDRAFGNRRSSILHRMDENELTRRALAFDDLWMLYLDTLERCARFSLESSWLAMEMSRRAALVAEAAYEDTRKPWTNEAFDEAVEILMLFAAERPTWVLQQVAAARRARPPFGRIVTGLEERRWQDERREGFPYGVLQVP